MDYRCVIRIHSLSSGSTSSSDVCPERNRSRAESFSVVMPRFSSSGAMSGRLSRMASARLVVDRDHLVDRPAAPVARVVTSLAADGTVMLVRMRLRVLFTGEHGGFLFRLLHEMAVCPVLSRHALVRLSPHRFATGDAGDRCFVPGQAGCGFFRLPGRLRPGFLRSGDTCAVARVGRRERLRPVRVHIVDRDCCFRYPFSRAVLRLLSIGRNRPRSVHLFPLRLGQFRLLFTVGTQQADEPLCGAQNQRAREQVRMHAHVPQPRDAAPCAVRMDRREHEMARRRAADRHRRRIGVADLAEHDDVRVLTQKGAQRSAEGQADLLFALYLVHSLERVFDRVLDRKDVARLAVQPPERRIERRALARAGRSGDQRHAVRARDGRLVVGELPLRETEVREAPATRHGASVGAARLSLRKSSEATRRAGRTCDRPGGRGCARPAAGGAPKYPNSP